MSMMRLIRGWVEQYFSDEEALFLLLLLVAGFVIVLTLGGELAPAIASVVVAYLLQGPVLALKRRGVGHTMASVIVLVGGITIYYFEVYWVDPLLGILISIYLIYIGYDLLKESIQILMLYTPVEISLDEVVSAVEKLRPNTRLHHIHIWKLNDTEIHLEAHLDLNDNLSLLEFQELQLQIEQLLWRQFKINHVTIQQSLVYRILGFFILYMLLFIIGAVVLSFFGLDFLSSIGASAASLGNVGPSLGDFGPVSTYASMPTGGKIWCSFLMLVGRLELFTALILFTPYFWRDH